MKRHEMFAAAGAGIVASALPLERAKSVASAANAVDAPPNLGKPVKPPAHGPLQVAFVVGPSTVLIDVAGPWEAFTDAMLPIYTYTVAPSMDDVDLGGIKAHAVQSAVRANRS